MLVMQTIKIKFIHQQHNLGFEEARKLWLLTANPVLLPVSVYRGNLCYRLPGTGRRLSYRQLKKGWVKKEFNIEFKIGPLPF